MSGEFVPFAHGHVSPEDTSPNGWRAYGESSYVRVRQLLDARETRFCELCGSRVQRRKEHRVGRYWLCDACMAAGGEEKINPRRRFLEQEVHDDDVLRRWGNGSFLAE
jgi:ribosomal protein L37AE/L43A